MKIKLPVTDKFLWKLYHLLREIDETYDWLTVRTQDKIWYPDLCKLRQNYQKEQARQEFSKFINYLKRHGYIKIKKLENKKGIILTPKGVEKALKTDLKMKKRRKRKDGKWQMIIFDIPEKKHLWRDSLREYLQILGYQKLQQSVWICSYDVYKETEDFIQKYSLDPYVRFFLIEEIEI